MNQRDYRDACIETLADGELALRHQWRLERAMLLNRLNQQHAEIAHLKRQVVNQRAELMRYTAHTVAGVAA